MGKLSKLEMRVNPAALPTSTDYTPEPRSLRCEAHFYADEVFKEDYSIKTTRARAQQSRKPLTLRTESVSWGVTDYEPTDIVIDLPNLMAADQAIIANELLRHCLKV